MGCRAGRISGMGRILAAALCLAAAGCLGPDKDSKKESTGINVKADSVGQDFTKLPALAKTDKANFATDVLTSRSPLYGTSDGGFFANPNGGYVLLAYGNQLKVLDSAGKVSRTIEIRTTSLGLTGFTAQVFLQAGAGRYIVAGVTADRLVVLSLDDSGTVQKNYQESMSGSTTALESAMFTSILEVPSSAGGGGGESFVLVGSDLKGHVKFMRLKADLGLEWTKDVDLEGESTTPFRGKNEAGFAAIPLKVIREGSNFYFCGQYKYRFQRTATYGRAIAGSFGMDGAVRWTLKWSEELPDTYQGAAHDLLVSDKGDLIVVGEHRSYIKSAQTIDMHLTKLSLDGKILKSVFYGGPTQVGAFGVIPHPGGGYLASVSGSNLADDRYAALVAFNEDLALTGFASADPVAGATRSIDVWGGEPLGLYTANGTHYLLGHGYSNSLAYAVKAFTLP